MDVRFVLSRVTYPAVLMSSLGLVAWLDVRGVSHGLIVFIVPVIVALVTFLLQQAMPYEPRWRGTAADWSVDLLHCLISTVLVTASLRMLLYDGAT